MKGIWQEKLHGYNRKGSKRKRQTRKHTLKDTVIWNFKNDKLYLEGEMLQHYYWFRQNTAYKFLYGKPLPVAYSDIFGMWSVRRRKWIQNYANHKDRVIIRDWILESDWNLEIKTHELSKSIAWMVW